MQLCVVVVVEAFDSGFLDGPIHPLDLPVGPGMLDLGQAVSDAVFFADTTEEMHEGIAVGTAVGELDAVIRQNRMQGVGHRLDHIAQELRCNQLGGRGMEFGERKLGRPVDGHEQIELALGRLHLCDVDVEVANRIVLELLFGRFVALDVWQSPDAMALQAAVQR